MKLRRNKEIPFKKWCRFCKYAIRDNGKYIICKRDKTYRNWVYDGCNYFVESEERSPQC